MTIRLAVIALAALIVLALVWYRRRHLKVAKQGVSDEPGRGLLGEIRTAFGDIARLFMNGDRDIQRRRDRQAEIGSMALNDLILKRRYRSQVVDEVADAI